MLEFSLQFSVYVSYLVIYCMYEFKYCEWNITTFVKKYKLIELVYENILIHTLLVNYFILKEKKLF